MYVRPFPPTPLAPTPLTLPVSTYPPLSPFPSLTPARPCVPHTPISGGQGCLELMSLELMEVLERMGERVAAMGLKCGERRLHQLANVFGEMRHPETVFSHFRLDAHEQETLFCFMQEEVEKLGDVRSSMERLNTLRSLLRKKKPAPATSLLSELQAASADALGDGEGKEESEKEGDSSAWMPRCDLPGAEEILKLTATISELQSRCLWSVELDHVVRLLVLAIILLRDRIISVFAINARSSDALTREGSLGRAGLALRYAKVINLAEKLMKYPFMAAGSTRDELDELYGLLTYSTKKDLALRLSHPSFSVAACFPSCFSYSCVSPSRDELYGLLTYSTKKDLALRLSRPVTSSKSKDPKAEETADTQTGKGAGKKGEKKKDGDEDEEDDDDDDDDDDGFTWLKKPSPLNDPRGLGGKGGAGKDGEEEDDEDMEEWERRMRKSLSLLPLLAQHTIAWNDAITVKPSSNRKATRLLRVQAVFEASLLDALVSRGALQHCTPIHPPNIRIRFPSAPFPPLQTLYHAQKAVIDASLLDALEGLSRLVASDASNLTQLNSCKMEAMAALAPRQGLTTHTSGLPFPLLPSPCPPLLPPPQTLYHAQKAVIDASLLDALEGVSRLVASDASNLTQLNSRKMEAMAAEARKKLDKTSADSKKPRAVMISGIFKPKRAAAGIVHGAPLPMVFEPATEVGKVTEKGKAPELSPRAAVPLSPTGASAAEPAASFLVKSGSVSAPRSVSPVSAAAAAAAGAASARTRFPTSASVSVAGASAGAYRSSDLTLKTPRPLPALPAAPASGPGQTTAPLPPSLLAQSLLSTSSLPSSQLASLEPIPPLSPPPSETLSTPPDALGSPKSPLKPRPPSQPPVRPPFRGSAANSVDLTGGGDNPRSPRGFVRAGAEATGGSAGAGGETGAGYADGPPRSPRAYVRFADAPAGLGGETSSSGSSSGSGSGDREEAAAPGAAAAVAAAGGFREGGTRDGSSSPASPHGLSRLSPSTPPNSNATDSSHANRSVSPLGQSHRSTPSITIIPPSHSRVSSTFRAPVPPALLSPTCVIYDATPKSPAPVASLQRLNARKETRDEPFVTTEGLLAQAQAEALKAQAQAQAEAQAEAEAEALKAQALNAQAMHTQAEVVKAHALKAQALKAQARAVKAQEEAEADVQAQAVARLQAQVSFSLDRSIGQGSRSALSESPKTPPTTAPASASASSHLPLSPSPSSPLPVFQPTSSSSPRPSTAPSSSSRPTTPSSRPTTPSSRPITPPLKTSLPFLLGTSSRPTTPPMLGSSSSVSSGSVMSSRPSDAVTCECRTGLGLRRDRLRNVWIERDDDDEEWDGERDREGDGRSLRDGAGGGATPPRSRGNSLSRSIGGALRVLQRGMSEQERGRHSSLRGSNLSMSSGSGAGSFGGRGSLRGGQGSGLGGGGRDGGGGGGGEGGSGAGVSSGTGGGSSGAAAAAAASGAATAAIAAAVAGPSGGSGGPAAGKAASGFRNKSVTGEGSIRSGGRNSVGGGESSGGGIYGVGSTGGGSTYSATSSNINYNSSGGSVSGSADSRIPFGFERPLPVVKRPSSSGGRRPASSGGRNGEALAKASPKETGGSDGDEPELQRASTRG
ncbi:unnamed protein product [Closterium sp. Naga37s-1]|nr:unnamed protein product [Closterium sp. Naga37s-1]